MIRVSDIADDRFLAYDIETTSVHAAYTSLRMVGYQLGLQNKPQLVDLKSSTERRRFRDLLRDPEIIKVSYNGINFDDMVLARHGFYVEPRNRHDMFLALKTIAPNLPSYSLKFVSWYFFGDWHEPERRLHAWLVHNGKGRQHYFDAPEKVLGPYCMHDVRQTVKIFRMIWEIIQRPLHWEVYNKMELAMAGPLHEMVLIAGEWFDPKQIKESIAALKEERQQMIDNVIKLSGGKITKPTSSTQVARYLHDENSVELELSKAGNYLAGKSELVEISSKNPIADGVLKIRDIGKVIQHYENYLDAVIYERLRRKNDPERLNRWLTKKGLNDEISADVPCFDAEESISRSSMIGSNTYEAIPKAYSMSNAKTRRFTSASQFGINFQNQNKRTKVVQLVPKGWLGIWIDSRQIENVVHIWASGDKVRRAAYEADINWNEYVWLCNQVLRKEHTRKELEDTVSPMNPAWSIYKTYKTVKLALNFFMGLRKFAKTTGLDMYRAERLFEEVHAACPAIRQIANVLIKGSRDGFIRDPFGHVYAVMEDTQKMVPYFVQGCGTGSVPKAMTVANYRTLHALDTKTMDFEPCVYNRFTRQFSYGIICGTTHDECAMRISLGLPTKTIIWLIRRCLYNMEEKFSPLFDNIPLRAQLAVSITNAGDQVELNHHAPDFEQRLINDFIKPGRRAIAGPL